MYYLNSCVNKFNKRPDDCSIVITQCNFMFIKIGNT